LGIPSNIAAADPTYDYEKAYNKYYEDDEEDFYGDGNDSEVARGSSQSNYPLQSPHHSFPIPPAVVNMYV